MKKYFPLLLALSCAPWGHSVAQVADEIDLSDVIVIEDAQPGPAAEVPEPDVSVVEIPEATEVLPDETEVVLELPGQAVEAVEGASIDMEVPVVPEPSISEPSIPEATQALPQETEIVLEIPGQEAQEPGEANMESDDTITVDFPDEDVRTILRNVADLFELNLVIPDTLQGRTSLKLSQITWQQVFEVVLEPFGFTYVKDRNIILIKSIEELTTEPVDTRVFVIAHAKAGELQASIAPLVDGGAGGRIQVDARSNALVITERPSRMNKIQEIIDRLDRPNDQVMIASRFVEVSQDDVRDLGLDWSYVDNTPTGNPSVPFTDGAEFGGFARPANAAGGLLAVFSQYRFAATLNALDQNTDTKLISNPTVVVMNNQEAILQVGEDFPIREFTVNRETGELESGEVEYRFVGIELKVTPSVNAAGMIGLDVHPTVSARLEDETVSGPDGIEDQIFRTREAQTKVTIKDGYTIALGGLTEETQSKGRDSIPLLGDVPVLGKLFQSNSNSVSNSNLIIFLTAKTLNPDGTTYREIIDPRVLDAVGHTESQTPGYQVPHSDLQLLREKEMRREALESQMLQREVLRRANEREPQLQKIAETLGLVESESAE